MPFNSKDIERALLVKMQAIYNPNGDMFYYIYDEAGVRIIRTKMSMKANRPIDDNLIFLMYKQLGLTKKQFEDLINCPLSREEALKIMKATPKPWKR